MESKRAKGGVGKRRDCAKEKNRVLFTLSLPQRKLTPTMGRPESLAPKGPFFRAYERVIRSSEGQDHLINFFFRVMHSVCIFFPPGVGEPTIYIQFIDDSVFQNSFVTENPMHSKDSIHQDRIHFALYRACSINSHFNRIL
jgi:hypothetical protein